MSNDKFEPRTPGAGARYYAALHGNPAEEVYSALANDASGERQAIDPDTLARASKANEMQIGGSHYASGYQHWDFVRELKLDYWQGCASKYVSRWRKKNGVEDLQKALHYIDKRVENTFPPASADVHWEAHSWTFRAIFRFGHANGLTLQEAEAIAYIVRGEWDSAREAIKHLIANYYADKMAISEL